MDDGWMDAFSNLYFWMRVSRVSQGDSSCYKKCQLDVHMMEVRMAGMSMRIRYEYEYLKTFA